MWIKHLFGKLIIVHVEYNFSFVIVVFALRFNILGCLLVRWLTSLIDIQEGAYQWLQGLQYSQFDPVVWQGYVDFLCLGSPDVNRNNITALFQSGVVKTIVLKSVRYLVIIVMMIQKCIKKNRKIDFSHLNGISVTFGFLGFWVFIYLKIIQMKVYDSLLAILRDTCKLVYRLIKKEDHSRMTKSYMNLK